MTAPIQLTPTLAIFEDDGEFTVRVNDSPLAKSLTPALLKAIGDATDARKLTLLTPTDTKIFRLNGPDRGKTESASSPSPKTESRGLQSDAAPKESIPNPLRRISQDQSAPPAPELAEEAIDEYDRAMEEARKAEEEQREMERLNRQNVDLPEPEPDAAPDRPAPRKRDRSRPAPAPTSTCGRCGGAGMLGGGGACPVCQGRGQIAKWGSRR